LPPAVIINLKTVSILHEGDEKCIKMIGITAGKRPFGRSSRRWEDNIGMNLREIG
jgi:hypothetical protein